MTVALKPSRRQVIKGVGALTIAFSLAGLVPSATAQAVRPGSLRSNPALDSWLRAKYARIYHAGRRVTDRTIARRYARQGPWAGLTLWCDMTRDWFDDDDPSPHLESLS